MFFPALVLDAILTGAKGMNLWSSFRVPPPQRSARLYRALVEQGLASSVFGALLPTEQPFLYTLSATANAGVGLASVEAALLEALDRVRADGVTPAEVQKAKAQLKARFVFDNDSVTNVAHQIGYFATIANTDVFFGLEHSVDRVTVDAVSAAAAHLLVPSNRTIGWFDPVTD
jgi:zinc protease